MSNLADLLPAGGGQNNTEFVADGNISAGAPVILTSDGKAAPISSSAADLGSEYQFEAARSLYIGTCFMGAPDNVVITTYRDNGNSGYGTAVVAQIYGNGLVSYGTPVVFNSASTNYTDCAWDENEHKIVVVFDNNGSSLGQGCVGTVSGTSISFGALASFNAAPTQYCQCAYDASDQKVIVIYTDQGNSNYATACAATISGTSVSWGTEYVIDSTTTGDHMAISYDSTAQKCVIGYKLSGNGGYGVVATTSSGAISFGTKTKFTDYIDYTRCAYDAAANKTLIAYTDAGTATPKVIAGTVSGTDISFGAATAYDGAGAGWHNDISYNSYASKCVLLYGDAGDSYKAKIRETTISGTTVTVSDATTVNTNGTNWHSTCPSVYGSVYRTYLAVDDEGDSDGVGYGYQPSQTTLTSTNLLGLAPEAISDTATGTINTWGSRCESSSLLGSGPSAGADAIYAPTPDDPYRYSMCYDTANDKVVIAYNDEANNYYLYACVGTVTGNAISWGTVVAVDETATMDQIQLTYDTNADRVLLVFRDQGTGGDLSGRVGTVSGTTISFGSKTTGTPHPSSLTSVYDPTEQKHLLTYRDNNNSNYGYSCVATVTGGATNTVAFGTQVQFSSDSNLAGDRFPMCYYTSENKIVMLYDIYFTGKYAVACTISGTSVSFGTPALSYAWATYGQLATTDITYDSTATKAVEIAAKSASPHILYASVISLSGATVTWASPVIASATSAGDSFRHAASIEYSSAGNNFLIAFSDDSNSSYLYAVSGTLSGTSTTWGTPVVVRSVSVASDQETDLIYDPDSQNFVVAYRTATPAGESNVISVGDLPLTVTSDYYVQTDGTLSTDTGGQLIGNAIKTNQINIKDYTG